MSTQVEPSPVVSVDDHILLLILNGSADWQGIAGDKAFRQRFTFGTMALIPAHYETGGRWSGDTTTAYLSLSSHLITQLADDAFHGDPAQVQLLPVRKSYDPLLRQLIFALCDELENSNPLGALFVESASRTIMLQLLRKYSTAAIKPPPTRTQLTDRQLRVVDDYLQNHLDSKISLSELASLLFMSVSHFERTFRATFGYAPYRYILERRIERSKWLLSKTSYSLPEIAYQSGFANQSHFTKHFTKFVGISPARFREYSKE